MGSAAAAGKDFPYDSRKTCYIEIDNDGSVSQGVDAQAYQPAASGGWGGSGDRFTVRVRRRSLTP